MIKKKQFLYMMQCGSGHIKIGIAANVEFRRNQVQTGNAEMVSVLGTFGPFVSASRIEGLVHKRLNEYRMAGEWFKVSQKVAAKVIAEELKNFVDAKETSEKTSSAADDFKFLFGPSFDDSIFGQATMGTLGNHSLVRPQLLN